MLLLGCYGNPEVLNMTERTVLKNTRLESENDLDSDSSPIDAYDEDQEFIVEAILAEKETAHGRLYLIFWLGYPKEECTW